jgi:hypothetical protein
MPRSYINHSLRTRAPYGPATVRAYEKEKSFAPALVSQEAAEGSGGGAGDGSRCGGSTT